MESKYIIVTLEMNMTATSNGCKTNVPRIKNIEVLLGAKSVAVTYIYRTKYRNNLLKLRLENG